MARAVKKEGGTGSKSGMNADGGWFASRAIKWSTPSMVRW